jgi:hypothetical protein
MGLSRSQNVAPVLGFLGRVFIDANASGLPVSPLVSELDDELFALNQRSRNERFPRPARDYLDEWAAPSAGTAGRCDWIRSAFASRWCARPSNPVPRNALGPDVVA